MTLCDKLKFGWESQKLLVFMVQEWDLKLSKKLAWGGASFVKICASSQTLELILERDGLSSDVLL